MRETGATPNRLNVSQVEAQIQNIHDWVIAVDRDLSQKDDRIAELKQDLPQKDIQIAELKAEKDALELQVSNLTRRMSTLTADYKRLCEAMKNQVATLHSNLIDFSSREALCSSEGADIPAQAVAEDGMEFGDCAQLHTPRADEVQAKDEEGDVGTVEAPSAHECPPGTAKEVVPDLNVSRQSKSCSKKEEQVLWSEREGVGFQMRSGAELLKACGRWIAGARSPIVVAAETQQRSLVTFQVEVSHLPLGLALGTTFPPDLPYYVLDFTVDRETTVGALKLMCLQRLYPNYNNDALFLSCLETFARDARIRLRDGKQKWQQDVNATLHEIGVNNGHCMTLEVIVEAEPSASGGVKDGASEGERTSYKNQSRAKQQQQKTAAYVTEIVRGTNRFSVPASMAHHQLSKKGVYSSEEEESEGEADYATSAVPHSLNIKFEDGSVNKSGRVSASVEVEIKFYSWMPFEGELRRVLARILASSTNGVNTAIPSSCHDTPAHSASDSTPPLAYDHHMVKFLRPLDTVLDTVRLEKSAVVEVLEDLAAAALSDLRKDWDAAVLRIKEEKKKKYKVLWKACKEGDRNKLMELLKDSSIDVNATEESTGNTALHMSTMRGNPGNTGATLCIFKKTEIDFNIRNKDGNTALDILNDYTEAPASTRKEFNNFYDAVWKFTLVTFLNL